MSAPLTRGCEFCDTHAVCFIHVPEYVADLESRVTALTSALAAERTARETAEREHEEALQQLDVQGQQLDGAVAAAADLHAAHAQTRAELERTKLRHERAATQTDAELATAQSELDFGAGTGRGG